MRRISAAGAAIFVVGSAALSGGASQTPSPSTPRLPLTVDSIMRGPELVGWPPTALRWSADSEKLYFGWRRPGDKTESLYVVGRDGRGLRKLSDEEAKNAPPANGRWDTARRRLLAADDGDV